MTVFSDTGCPRCGIRFGLPLDYESALRKSGNDFWCPNGHSLTFGKCEADKLREELSRERQRNAQLHDEAEAARRQAAAFKGHATRIRNRVQHGVCPCCNRTFKNLASHMASKHPEHAANNVISIEAAKA